jgi:hypothetical protein
MRVTLREVEDAVRAAWGADTVYARAGALERAPELAARGRGQCGATALVVQDLLGGELVMAEATVGGVRDGVHYWNRFGEVDVDLTRDQFLADEVIDAGRVVRRPETGIPPSPAKDAYLVLRGRVFGLLGLPDGGCDGEDAGQGAEVGGTAGETDEVREPARR